MSEFIILSDSACDLPKEIKKQYNIGVIPFYVSLDKENYLRENIDIEMKEFYERITKEKIIPKTSLPSIDDYSNYFKEYLVKGLDILCFTISSDLSGSYQSATNAANILLEDYPERKIFVIDSRKASVAQGLLVLEAAKMKNEGFSLEEVHSKLEDLKSEGIIIFTTDSLEHLQKGGRIGKASALAGTLLNIKPILVLNDGVLEPHSKVRGRKKSIIELSNIIKEYLKEDLSNYEIAIASTNIKEEASELESIIKEKYDIKFSYPIFDIGVAVGSHTGGTTIGIGFIKKYNA